MVNHAEIGVNHSEIGVSHSEIGVTHTELGVNGTDFVVKERPVLSPDGEFGVSHSDFRVCDRFGGAAAPSETREDDSLPFREEGVKHASR